jgi:hypothetical protein
MSADVEFEGFKYGKLQDIGPSNGIKCAVEDCPIRIDPEHPAVGQSSERKGANDKWTTFCSKEHERQFKMGRF